MPVWFQLDGVNLPYAPPNPSRACTYKTKPDNPLTCSLSTDQLTLIIEGAFKTRYDYDSSKTERIEVEVSDVRTPISTAEATGFSVKVVSAKSDLQVVMDKDNLSVKVDLPSIIPSRASEHTYTHPIGVLPAIDLKPKLNKYVLKDAFYYEIVTEVKAGDPQSQYLDLSGGSLIRQDTKLGVIADKTTTRKLTSLYPLVDNDDIKAGNTIPMPVYNIKTQNYAGEAFLTLNVYDKDFKIAQTSKDPKFAVGVFSHKIVVTASQISGFSTEQVSPVFYGSVSVLKIGWVLSTPLSKDTIVRLTRKANSGAGAPSPGAPDLKFPHLGDPGCKVNENSVNCAVSEKILASAIIEPLFPDGVTEVAKGTSFVFEVANTRNPFCEDLNLKVELLRPNGAHFNKIEEGSLKLAASTFKESTLSINLVSQSSKVIDYLNNLELTISYIIVLEPGSVIIIKLQSDVGWVEGTSSCQINSGLSSGAESTFDAKNHQIVISKGIDSIFPSDQAKEIKLTLNSIRNPIPIAKHAFEVQIYQKSDLSCSYAKGSFEIETDAIQPLTATFESLNPKLNA